MTGVQTCALPIYAKAQFGVAVIVDCHSMPPLSHRSDIVIGDCYGEAASSDLIAHTQRWLADLGFSVARNTPYAGGYTTSLYGKPREGVHAIQIELSRALYLDEARMEKTTGFSDCKARLGRFVGRLLETEGSWLSR